MRELIFIAILFWSVSAAAGVSEWIPFQQQRGHIVVPVTLNGERSTALFDTGSSGNAISEHFLENHEGEYGTGKSIIVRGVYGERRVNLINNVSVGMFGTEFRLDELMPAGLGSADLLIGLPFFEQFIVQIDYPAGQMRLIDHESLELKSVANVKMKRERGTSHPLVEIDLNHEYSAWVLFDTGNSGGILMPRRVAERFDWLETYGTQQSLGVGVNAMVARNERLNLPSMTLGPYELEGVIVTVPADGQRSNIAAGVEHGSIAGLNKRQAEGILGYDVLRHFIVTIDFKNSYLHMEIPAPLETD